jgi:hypothetical protein
VKLVEPPPSCSSASAIVFIGQNSRGKWVAQEQNGLFGGLFVSRKEAVKYALFENGRHPGAILELSREIELDMGGYGHCGPDRFSGKRILDMAMLTNSGNRFKRASHSSGRRATAGATPVGAHLAVFKRFCVCAVAVMLAGGAFPGIIAVKTAAYFWRFPY